MNTLRLPLLFLFLLGLMLTGCDEPTQVSSAEQRVISGDIGYRERIALPSDSVAKIILENLSPAEDEHKTVAETTIILAGQQVPISFQLRVDKSDLKPGGQYALWASLNDSHGSLLWSTDKKYPIDANAAHTELGHLELVRTMPENAGNSQSTAIFQCGDTRLTARFEKQSVELDFEQKNYSLQVVQAASGAKYQSANGEIVFWNKGNRALLTVTEQTLPECIEQTDRNSAPLPFTAHGNEPGWTLVADQHQLEVKWDYGQQQLVFPEPRLQSRANGFQLYGQIPQASVVVSTTQTICYDVMSGRPFPYQVAVELPSTSLAGCGGNSHNLLTGQEWIVEDIDQRGIIDASHITLQFNNDGRLSGLASCNHYSASYHFGESLQISNAISTRKACAPALMNQESLFLSILAEVRDVRFDETAALILTTADGRTLTARR